MKESDRVLGYEDEPGLIKRVESQVTTVNLTELHGYSIAAVEQAEFITVTDDEEQAMAISKATEIADARRKCEEKRKQETDPFVELTNRIRSWFRPIEDSLLKAEGIISVKLIAYRKRKEEIRKEEDARQREEYLKNAPPDAPPPPVLMQEAKTVKAETGKGTVRMVWMFEVLDINLVPVEYLKREVKKLEVQNAIRRGVKTIPGLRIYQEEDMSFSSKR